MEVNKDRGRKTDLESTMQNSDGLFHFPDRPAHLESHISTL